MKEQNANTESVGEIKLVRLCDIPDRRIPTRWGRWRLNRRHDTLEFHEADRGMLYEIDLADARESIAACLDWIFQVSSKTWMTDKDRGDLLKAIRDTINPQATLCSGGIGSGRQR